MLAGLGDGRARRADDARPGVHVELRWPVLAAALLALGAAFVGVAAGQWPHARPAGARAAAPGARARSLAGRRRRGRGGRPRRGVARSPRSATRRRRSRCWRPALLAVVAGIITARLLGLWSRTAGPTTRAARPGAGPARPRPAVPPSAGPAVIVVVTVAVALLSFAATAWDVAAQARRDVAADTVGADRVVQVGAAHPAALVAAVAAADPTATPCRWYGRPSATATRTVELVGVQSRPAGRRRGLAGSRPGRGRKTRRQAATAAGAAAGSRRLRRGRRDRRAACPARSRLAAVVAPAGEPARTVSLGALVDGLAPLPRPARRAARPGCRLLGLADRAGAPARTR